jgi:hypothetical protein
MIGVNEGNERSSYGEVLDALTPNERKALILSKLQTKVRTMT